MHYNKQIINYLQSNNILALKLDHALNGVGQAVSHQIEAIGAGATRALYYTSCFTDEYQDVCQQQKKEDIRFALGAIRLLQHDSIVYDMLRIYFEEIFKYKTYEQIEHIKKMLMAVNVHIATSSLTGHGFALATAVLVTQGMNLSMVMSSLTKHMAGKALMVTGLYSIIQKAADCAHRLHFTCPSYYAALYAQELEMMYFLIAPLFERTGALDVQRASDEGIAEIITKMIR